MSDQVRMRIMDKPNEVFLEYYEIKKRDSSEKEAKEEAKKILLDRFETYSQTQLNSSKTYELAKEIFSEKEYQSLENFARLFQGKIYSYIDLLKAVEEGSLPLEDVLKGVVRNGTRGYWERIIHPIELIGYRIMEFVEGHRL